MPRSRKSNYDDYIIVFRNNHLYEYYKEIDYDSLKKEFFNESQKLKAKYLDTFLVPDKSNRTYQDKADFYINYGIYRLENRVKKYNLSVIALEKEFYLDFNKHTFHGFIV